MTQLSNKRIPRRLHSSNNQQRYPIDGQILRDEFYRQSYQVFERLRPRLIDRHYNWFFIVEPNSEDYFLAEDELLAYQQARNKYP